MSRPSKRRQQKQKKRERQKQRASQKARHAEKQVDEAFSLTDMPRITERMFRGAKADASHDSAAAAQELAFEAMESDDPDRAFDLVMRALDLDRECVDALALLAEAFEGRDDRLRALEFAVDAGMRKLGEDYFEEHRGYFWGLLETRPYMRARSKLANELADAGRIAEAIHHYEAMLELCPGDNLGLRYILVGHYLAEDRRGDARELLEQFDDDFMATWAWARVLESWLAGDLASARTELDRARQKNSAVEEFLLGRRRLPKEAPGYYSPGDESEAIITAMNLSAAWHAHSDALAWLRDPSDQKEVADHGAKKIARQEQGRRELESVSPPESQGTVRRLDPDVLRKLEREIRKHLAPLAEDLDLEFVTRDWKWTEANAVLRLEVATKRQDGVAMTQEAQDFLARAEEFGLDSDDLGRVFELDDRPLRIVGAPPRKKGVVNCEDPVSGARYQLPAALLRAELGRGPQQRSFVEVELTAQEERPLHRQHSEDLCSCGSGRRFKDCCFAELQRRLREFGN